MYKKRDNTEQANFNIELACRRYISINVCLIGVFPEAMIIGFHRTGL
jgi:hypothetical protein